MYAKAEFLNPYYLYHKTYKTYPSRYIIKDIDNIKLFNELIKKYQVPENKIILSSYISGKNNELSSDYFYVDLGNGICVYLENEHFYNNVIEIIYSFQSYTNNKELIEELKNFISEFKIQKDYRKKLYLLCGDEEGFNLQEFYINEIEIDIELNYNDSLLPISKKIEERLNKKNDKGIVFLFGKPGTGKSHFLRYLINKINKKIIYITPDVAKYLGSPNFLGFLVEHPESVLIIEDAENVIQERAQIRSDVVSNLLNMSDGLLSDCLNIQIICTFNLDIKNVDKAFLRKGRLIARYEFTELEINKAQKLLNHLGFDQKVEKPMTLAEIYNLNETDLGLDFNETKAIGFR